MGHRLRCLHRIWYWVFITLLKEEKVKQRTSSTRRRNQVLFSRRSDYCAQRRKADLHAIINVKVMIKQKDDTLVEELIETTVGRVIFQ